MSPEFGFLASLLVSMTIFNVSANACDAEFRHKLNGFSENGRKAIVEVFMNEELHQVLLIDLDKHVAEKEYTTNPYWVRHTLRSSYPGISEKTLIEVSKEFIKTEMPKVLKDIRSVKLADPKTVTKFSSLDKLRIPGVKGKFSEIDRPKEEGLMDSGADLYFSPETKGQQPIVVSRKTRSPQTSVMESVEVDGIYVNKQNTYGLLTHGGCDFSFSVIYLGKIAKFGKTNP
ncbi:MAG TPA: hypothetical protein VM901_08150 [Bdellovibrionota bacterium]|jgi:hypothetical protein|nr:hypothetical protein [Bdellovibrionota bacterium]